MMTHRKTLIGGVVLLFCGFVSWTIGVSLLPAAVAKETGQAEFALPRKNETHLTASQQRGKVSYDYYCVLCHGTAGESDGFNAPNLLVPAANHADANRMLARSDAQIHSAIKEGGAVLGLSTQMPPWGGVLTDQQLTDLVAYLRSLAKPGGGSQP